MNPRSLRWWVVSLQAASLVAAWGVGTVCAQTSDLPVTNDQAPPPLKPDDMLHLPPMPSAGTTFRPRRSVMLYFSPVPPALEAFIPPPGNFRSYAPPPEELGLYEGEVFYPMLGVRMARVTLKPPLSRRVDDYHELRTFLLEQLHTELSRVENLGAAERLGALEALAARQAPRLANLEAQAEALRSDLIESDAVWASIRTWHLSKPEKLGYNPREVSAVMREAAYYMPFLLPAQRGLLREVALDVQSAAQLTMGRNKFVFFGPELAQFPDPTDLPTAVAQRFADYQTKREELKKELYDAVTALDKSGWWTKGTRDKELRALAARQAPEIAALEGMGEEIRRQLPEHYGPKPPRSVLSSASFDRVLNWTTKRDELRNDIKAQTFSLGASYSSSIILIPKFEGRALSFNARPASREATPLTPEDQEILQQKVKPIVAEYNWRYDLIAGEGEAIFAEVGRALRTDSPEAINATIEAVPRVAAQEPYALAREDYRIAMFEPGLSPAQRRLLFAAATREFELPAGGERQFLGILD